MIEVMHLTVRHGRQVVVDDISFKVRNGRIYGLLGPDGAGKTDVLLTMAGGRTPVAGTVLVNGYDVIRRPREVKRQIGYVPEDTPFFPDMTPYEYLEFVAEAKGVRTETAIHQIHELLSLTGTMDVRNVLLRNLTGERRRRVAIAGALVGDPDTLLLDEPAGDAVPDEIERLYALIRKLGAGKTVMIASRNATGIRETCDHVIVLKQGRIVADEEITPAGEGTKPTPDGNGTDNGEEVSDV